MTQASSATPLRRAADQAAGIRCAKPAAHASECEMAHLHCILPGTFRLQTPSQAHIARYEAKQGKLHLQRFLAVSLVSERQSIKP